MILMYDSTEPGQIPAQAQAVAGYVGGRWPDYNEDVKRWPKAHHLSIAVASDEDADCLDIEPGNAPPSSAPGWFWRQKQRGLKRKPVFYADGSEMPQVTAALAAAGIRRSEYMLWLADPTGKPHIPDGMDGCQFAWNALGRNLDASVCSDAFFGVPPAPNTWQPHDEVNWCREWDRLKPRVDVAAKARKVFLRLQMLNRRRNITKAARQTGWHFRNRLYRYEQLQRRTG